MLCDSTITKSGSVSKYRVTKIVVFQLVPVFLGSLAILLPLFEEATAVMGDCYG